MSLCTECGVDKFVEVEMVSVGVGILGALHKTGIMQLTIRTKTHFAYGVCCSTSSFGLDSLPRDHVMKSSLLYKLLAFALFCTLISFPSSLLYKIQT